LEADVDDRGDRLVFRVKAQSFLYHMVRRLVGAALEVGKGRVSVGAFRELLETGAHSFVPPTAPARGLVFWSVDYRPPYAGLFGSLLGGTT
jgi:tRNA pseudouridine38-40 synthase